MQQVYKNTLISGDSCDERRKTRPDVLGRFKGFIGGVKSEFENRKGSSEGVHFDSGVSIIDCTVSTFRNVYDGAEFGSAFIRLYTDSLSDYC